jgi:hypothetical protein
LRIGDPGGDAVESSVVAVRVYNGTFVPVLNSASKIRRRLVLTTVRDNQTSVKIDLYRGSDEEMADSEYVGSLVIESIAPSPKGDPDITLLMGVDDSGNLNATATDTSSGEYQSLSVSLESLEPGGTYDIPDFELNDEELTVDDLSLDDEVLADLDTTSVGGSSEELPSDDLDLESISLDDFGGEAPAESPAEAATEPAAEIAGDQVPAFSLEEDDLTLDKVSESSGEALVDTESPEPVAVGEVSEGEEASIGNNLDLGGLPEFSDDSVSLDESLSLEESESSGDEEISFGDEPALESDEMSLSSLSIDEEPEEAESDFGEEIELEGPVDEAEAASEAPPEVGEDMVEAELGEEDFTFDEEIADTSLFEEESEFGNEFESALDAEITEPSTEDLGEPGELPEEELSAAEFDRLDSEPVAAAAQLSIGGEEELPAPRRSNALIFVGYLVLALAAIAVITYFIFRLMEGPPAPPLRTALDWRLAGLPLLAVWRRIPGSCRRACRKQ